MSGDGKLITISMTVSSTLQYYYFGLCATVARPNRRPFVNAAYTATVAAVVLSVGSAEGALCKDG